MSYHDNPRINNVVLTIINDGNGEQCGMDYKARCAAADTGIAQYRIAVKRYGERYYGKLELGAKPGTGTGWSDRWTIIAADILQNYYREHMKEVQS